MLLQRRFLGRALAALAAADVRVVEEPGEQHEVTEVHGRGQGNVQVGHPARLRAARLQVSVRGVVDEAADHHLRQLAGCDHHGHGLGRPVAHRPHRVVRVHHRVHRVVHDDEPPGGRGEFVIREPAVQQHGDVMVPVKEDERLFAQHDEYGVTEFG